MAKDNRFQQARTLYNQHGSQTVKQVAQDTGITPSLIDELESNTSKRGVAYQKVLTLAEHYGVSLDWLLGRHDSVKTVNPEVSAICKYVHLSEEAVDFLSMDGGDRISDYLISSGSLSVLSDLIESYIFVTQEHRQKSIKLECTVKREAEGKADKYDVNGALNKRNEAYKEAAFEEYRITLLMRELLEEIRGKFVNEGGRDYYKEGSLIYAEDKYLRYTDDFLDWEDNDLLEEQELDINKEL